LIEVEGLTKRYGDFLAIQDVSFKVEKGQVLGFLGPNGSGKTTTMRILTCFMPATAGTAKVCGHDIFEDSMAVRQNIGYMPENVPLYPNLRVNEYLRYRAKLKGLGRAERRRQIAALVERCAIREFERVIVGKLSKGMKQRVGLAATLLGDPPVLVLDEPTVGLDPNQIREIRGLIKSLGGERTVILSTHILPEVEMVCDHLAIIKEGRIALTGSLEEITRAAGGSRVRVEARGDGRRIKDALEKVSGVRRVAMTEKDGAAVFEIEVAAGADAREGLVKAVSGAGGSLLELSCGRTSIEDVFVRITATED
jgi:ABC-2 type transport system ATP-binding protein